MIVCVFSFPRKGGLGRNLREGGKVLGATTPLSPVRVSPPPTPPHAFLGSSANGVAFAFPIVIVHSLRSLKSFWHEQSATVLVFLSDLPESSGGGLIFPAADPPVKIVPKKGMAVVWHNSGADGGLDERSVHGEMR